MTPSDIRHALHQHPGISGQEQYAHDLIANELSSCHPDQLHTHVGGYGIIAIWGTVPTNLTIAMRCDIDALPIGHRCGHDGHATILLQVAHWLGDNFHDSDHNVILVFQPEEETGTGAEKIINADILQQYNIVAIFGFHNLPGFPLGTVVLNRGAFAAASSGIIYNLKGRATHASTPEKGINPGLAVAEIIREFDKLNSSPNQTGDNFRQCTLICVHLGDEAFGTSAGEAEIMYTLRAFSNNTIHQLIAQANNIVALTAARHHLTVESTVRDPFSATVNHARLVERLERVAAKAGIPLEYKEGPFRWSEDFGRYLAMFPGAMFGIGSGEDQPELHHPEYDFPDQLIGPATQFVTTVISDFCENTTMVDQ